VGPSCHHAGGQPPLHLIYRLSTAWGAAWEDSCTSLLAEAHRQREGTSEEVEGLIDRLPAESRRRPPRGRRIKDVPEAAARSLWPLVVVLTLAAGQAYPCSTFLISRNGSLVVAHNLDQEFFTPGMIHINRRAERKRSVSLFDLGVSEQATPIVEWSSKYGSVTLGMLGRNLPDGGMNEVGLTVSEMALGQSVYSFDPSRPTLLIHLWIQYQLDNHASVREVVEHVSDFNIEPGSTFTPPASANYHLFVSDRTGAFAIIEFLEGGPRVYSGDEAPAPVLCNDTYTRELQELERHQGLVGWIRRNLSRREDLRFVTGALAVEHFDPNEDGDPVSYSFATLHSMQLDRTKQWSVVYDVANRRVYFETARGGERGHLDLEAIDFGADAPSLVLADIDLVRGGDVTRELVDFSRAIDRSVIARFLRSLAQFVAETGDPAAVDRHMMEAYGFEVEGYVERALEASELIRLVDRTSDS
jgi:penicillin V acylase-like amidase (Ntn superfamily)